MPTSRKLAEFWEQDLMRHVDKKIIAPYGYDWGGPGLYTSMAMLSRHYLESASILEIGCGGGKWTKWLFDTCHAASVLATDVHQPALDLAAQYEPRATYELTDGVYLPDAHVDAVFSFDVFLHLPKGLVFRYMQESYMIASRMIFALPDLRYPDAQNQFTKQATCSMWQDPYTSGYIEFWTREEALTLLELACFKGTYLGGLDDYVTDKAQGSFMRDSVFVGVKDG
jgi:cyclopropane fatty-acyl-phospholipid synthase-like methyltransferase